MQMLQEYRLRKKFSKGSDHIDQLFCGFFNKHGNDSLLIDTLVIRLEFIEKTKLVWKQLHNNQTYRQFKTCCTQKPRRKSLCLCNTDMAMEFIDRK